MHEKLYFGMKDVSEFSRETSEHAPFGVIVSASHTSRRSFASQKRTKRMECQRVSRSVSVIGKGTLGDGTDEVLFEIDSEFVVERTKEVAEVEVRCCQTSV